MHTCRSPVLCVGVCVITLCSCWQPQQLLHSSAMKSSSGCIQVLLPFWYLWLNIIISRALLSAHEKESAHTHTHRETEWACDLGETRLIFGRIFHTSHFPLTECRAHLSGRKSRLTALYHTTWQALINFQKWSRVRSQRHSLKNMHPYGVII